MSICVLLSTYNGERYLREQLDSLLNQRLFPDKIFIRDDGSEDGTVAILKEYASSFSVIDCSFGDNIGITASYFALIKEHDNYDYYALCDQDDLWFSDKLERALSVLKDKDNGLPMLYMSRFTLTDASLSVCDSELSDLYSYCDFAHSLLYTSAPGCTFVFDKKAREKVLLYIDSGKDCPIHDSLIHKVAALFGTVILDKESHLYYRQHGDNAIGFKASSLSAFLKRFHNFTSGKSRHSRSKLAASLLAVYGEEADDFKRKLIKAVAFYAKDTHYRNLLLSKPFQTKGINRFFFRILVLFRYI